MHQATGTNVELGDYSSKSFSPMSRNKMDSQTIAMTDQLSTAVREVFQEKGYHDIQVTIAEEADGSLSFEMGLKGGEEILSEETVDSVITEALHRIGATIKGEE
jgi:hypothetical protein